MTANGRRSQPANARRKASWARLIQKVYEVDPLECTRCGTTMCVVALIDDADVVNRRSLASSRRPKT